MHILRDSGGLLSSWCLAWCQVVLLPRKEEQEMSCLLLYSLDFSNIRYKKTYEIRQFPPELIAKTLQKIGNFDINS